MENKEMILALVIAALFISVSILVAGNSISTSLSKLELKLSAAGSGTPAGAPVPVGTGSRGADGGAAAGGQEAGAAPGAPTFALEGSSVKGAEGATVMIVEFSDFQCPFCRRFYNDAYPQIKADYIDTGKVRLVYKNFPLNSIHPAAQKSAEAGLCALDQGRFWEMHDKLYEEQNTLNPQGGTVAYGVEEIKQWASEIAGMDAQRFNSCLDSGEKAGRVEAEFNDGVAAGVSGTPAFFVNGKALVGAQPYSVFKAAIDAALSSAG